MKLFSGNVHWSVVITVAKTHLFKAKLGTFKWHNPVPSPDHPNHYMTFLEACNTETESIKTGDVGLPYSLVAVHIA